MNFRCYLVYSIFCFAFFQGTQPEEICGIFEEGKPGSLSCSTNIWNFVSLQPRIEIDGEFLQFGSCDSAGNECSSQPGYLTKLETEPGSSRKKVTLYIDKVLRTMTRSRCYMDYRPLSGQDCTIVVYVKPSLPVCQPPVFSEDGTVSLLTCISNRVYPKGKCNFTLTDGKPAIASYLTVRAENTNSSSFAGDQEVTCRLSIPVARADEGIYRLRAEVFPDIEGIPDSAKVFAEQMAPLHLMATALYSPGENNHVFQFPMTGKLKIDVHIIGNPPPNRILLKVSQDNSSSPVPVSSLEYSTTYNSTAGSDGGILTLVLSVGLEYGRDSFYSLELSNGIISPTQCEYNFFLNVSGVHINKPTCQPTVFTNQGASAIITCTSDRVHVKGKCHFTVMGSNSTIEMHATMTSLNKKSTTYPGDQEVTCQLLISITGAQEGMFWFRVGIIPDLPGVPDSAKIFADQIPGIDLSPIRLYKSDDTDHVFDFPLNGELKIDVHITGNPPPNRILLKVSQDNSSSPVPVSSLEYSTTYNSTAGSDGGILTLVLSVGLEYGRDSFYTLELSNGIISPTPCKYNFRVTGSKVHIHKPTCQTPEFTDQGTSVLLTCTSDRVYLQGTCDCTVIEEISEIQKKVSITTINSESKRYPGDQEVTCKIRVSITGTQKGSYRFRVAVSPDIPGVRDSFKVFADLIPRLDLSPSLLFDPDDQDHVVNFPKSGDLHIDLHVTGNPPPNRVLLTVRETASSSPVAVSSRDFNTSYVTTAGSVGGVLTLLLSRSLVADRDRFYALKLSNGVTGSTQFQYNFSVRESQDVKQEQVTEEKKLVFHIGLGVGAFGILLVLAVAIFFAARNCRKPKKDPHDGDYIMPCNPESIWSDGQWDSAGGTAQTEQPTDIDPSQDYVDIDAENKIRSPMEENIETLPMTASSTDSSVQLTSNDSKFTTDVVAIQGTPGVMINRSSATDCSVQRPTSSSGERSALSTDDRVSI